MAKTVELDNYVKKDIRIGLMGLMNNVIASGAKPPDWEKLLWQAWETVMRVETKIHGVLKKG